ncbi:Mrpl11p [Saccharomyces cerevisiae x Saccharomyces kudriavzevii VIN7]|uniref:Mrpl11p n=1 Tax=Saccharomyces cerevisiae x Saccharomyces kudriavzevii (strain VIN7) TaxID=1095631 RepID=H0H2P9_SACCK|nr:Mrpl11p [Saccharomyces cerevisiae x Saccharomyces kudriavzevii VIN7]
MLRSRFIPKRVSRNGFFALTDTIGVSNRFYALASEQVSRKTVKPLDSRKTFLVDTYKHLMENSSVVLFAHYNNLSKTEDHHFRFKIKQTGGTLTKVRNNLFEVYLKNSHLPDPCGFVKRKEQNRSHPLLPLLKGPTAAITYEDANPQQVAKLLKLLQSAQDKLLVIGAKVENQVLNVEKLNDFKSLPTKLEMQSQLAAVLQMLSGLGLVRTLESGSNALYLTLKSHHDNQKPKEDAENSSADDKSVESK